MLLALPDVIKSTTLCRSVIYRLVAEGRFPRPVSIPGARRSAWRQDDVQKWIDSLK